MADRTSTLRRPGSLWRAARRDWYRDSFRTEILEATLLPRIALTVGALGLIWHGSVRLPQPLGWGLLALGLLAGLLVWGLYTCRLWAGRVTGGVAAALALCWMAGIVLGLVRGRPGSALNLPYALCLVYAAVEMLRPSARELFRKARVGPPDDPPPA